MSTNTSAPSPKIVVVLRASYAQFATDDRDLPAQFAHFAQQTTLSSDSMLRLTQPIEDFDAARFK